MAFGYDGSIRIDTKVNRKGFNSGIQSMMGSLGKLAAAVGVAFGVAAIVNFGKAALEAASDVQEVQNVVDTAFGNMAYKAEEFASTAIEQFGMSELSAKKAASTYMAMGKSMGLTMDAASDMAIAVAGLTGDVASFYNISQDLASIKLKAIWTGETEGLKDLGVVMTQTNLQEFARRKGIEKTISAMSQAELVTLRYQYVMQSLSDAQGDFAKTSDSYANQIRILSERFTELKIAFGNGLIPIAKAILPGINSIIAALTQLANTFSQVTTLLFGDQSKAQEDLAASGNAAADANDHLAGSTEDVGNSAEKTKKQIEGSLAGFDKLNKLADKTADSVGDISSDLDMEGKLPEELPEQGLQGGELWGGVTISPDVEKAVLQFKAWLDEIKAMLGQIWSVFDDSWDKYGAGVIESAKSALIGIWELLKAIATTITDVFTSGAGERFLENIMALISGILNFIASLANQLKDVWNRMGENLAEAFFYAINSIIELVRSIGSAFAEAWNNGTGVEILETIMSIITGIFILVGELANRFREAWEVNKNGVQIWQSILNIIQLVLDFVDRIVQSTITWAQGLNLEPLATAFRNLLEVIEPFVSVVLDGLAWYYENVLLPFGKWMIEERMAAGFDLISAAINALTAIIEALKPLALWLWENFLEPLRQFNFDITIAALNAITDALNHFATWVRENQSAVQGITVVIGLFFAAWKGTELAAFVINAGGVVVILNKLATAIKAATIAKIADKIETLQIVALYIGDFIKGIGSATVSFVNQAKAIIALTAAKIADKVETLQIVALYVGDFIKSIASATVSFIKNTAAIVASTAAKIADKIALYAMTAAALVWNGIVAVATALTTAFGAALTFLTSPIGLVVLAIAALVAIVVLLVKNWDTVAEFAIKAWEAIKNAWSSAGEWFSQNVVEPIKQAFRDGINFMIGGVEGFINFFINGINAIINALNLLHIDIPDWVPLIGGKKFGFNITPLQEVSLPRLANGAVIPPNRQFAAILGDQRSGTNIEAPLATIEQAFANIMQKSGYAGEAVEVNIHFSGDLAQIARLMNPVIERTKRISGQSFVRAGL